MSRTVVTSFDGNYFNYSMVLARSLADNYNGGERLEFICLVPLDLAAREEEYIATVDRRDKLQISFRTSNGYEELVAGGEFDQSDMLPYVTSNTMQRVFLSSTLHDYDQVIYIDPDTLIVRDVSNLLNYSLVNKFLAVVESGPQNVRTFEDPDRPYFNVGVFITSLEYWRAARIEDQMLSYLTFNGPTECRDQDLMNRFLFDVMSPLNISFNYFRECFTDQLTRNALPMIIHFAGPLKPWLLDLEETKQDLAWRKIYQEIFPGEELWNNK